MTVSLWYCCGVTALTVSKTIRFHETNNDLLVELSTQENLSQSQIVNILLRRFGRIAFPSPKDVDVTPQLPVLKYQPRN